MYRVTVFESEKEYPILDRRDEALFLLEPELSLEMGKSGEFTFRIHPDHEHYHRIFPIQSEIRVYDNGKQIWGGRPMPCDTDFYNIMTVECEGELSYLVDSQQRPYEFSGDAISFYKQLIAVHNSQVEPRKQFTVGIVNVVDHEPEVFRRSTKCMNTLEVMNAELVGRNGGYLRVRYEDGKKYLDYINDYGGENRQVIRFGENLIDFGQTKDPTTIKTALIPYGGIPESDDPDNQKPIDIKSVNGGLDYIYDQEAVNKYGWIWESTEFANILDPEILKIAAESYLNEIILLPDTLELTAVDLGIIDIDISKFELGKWTWLESKPHRIKKRFMLSKKVLKLNDPGNDRIILGQTIKTFAESSAESQKEISDTIERLAESTSKEIIKKIQNATNLITGGTGGYLVIDIYDPITGKKKHPWRMLIMDTPDKETAKNVWQFNMNGLGFSRTGINGPYENAWTIDGNLIADFITAGTMLADRIRGGVLEIGGKGIGRDGRIVVKDANDKEIGYWDKTGLHVLLGVIEGSEIIGSSIIGGVINIGNGTFTVDEDGAVSIGSGEIGIGNVLIKEGYTWLGDFGISSTGDGLLYSRDDGNTVKISSSNYWDWLGYPHITLQKGDMRVEIDPRGISCEDVHFFDSWTEHMSLLEMLKEIYDRINRLEG